MKTNNILYLLLLIITISACRKDTHQIFTDDKNQTEEVFRQSNVTGIVLDETGQAVNGATVSLGGLETTTDHDGVFLFIDAPVSSKGSLININKSSYFSSHRFVYNEPGQGAYVNVKLLRKQEVERFDNDSGTQIYFGDKAYLRFLPNVVAREDGEPYDGEVVLYAHYFDPELSETMRTMPGDLRGLNANEEQMQLATFGMFAVELETPSGMPLNIAADKFVNMNFIVNPDILTFVADSVPMWSFDEVSGFWEEEGFASLDETILGARVSHFSFWNCDIPFPFAEIKGILTNPEGQAVPNKAVTIKAFESLQSGIGYTNNNGVFEGKVPADVALSLYVEECGEEILSENLGSLSEGYTDLGSFVKPTSNTEMIITGQMLDCMKQGLSDAYGILKIGERTELVLPNSDGTFNHIFNTCGETDITLSFIDPLNLQFKEAIDIPTEFPTVELFEVDICGDFEEFIRYTINGDLNNIINDAEVTIVDGKYLHIHAEMEATNLLVTVLFRLDETGIYREWMHMKGKQGNGDPLYIETGDLSFEGDNIEIEGLSEGDMISGSFNSTNSPFEHEIEGNFSFSVDRIVETATISGYVWHDANQDGLQTDGEQYISDIQTFIAVPSGDTPTLYYNESADGKTDENGYYDRAGLEPGYTYQIFRYDDSLYDMTEAGVGNDNTKDSDLFPDSDNKYSSEFIFLEEGEHVEHIDIGLIIVNTSCNSSVQYCSPSAELSINMNGGVPPYTAELDNGMSMSGDPVIFENLAVGEYAYTITDDVGTMCDGVAIVNDDRNIIRGNIWIDLPGGTDDVWDPSIEFTGVNPYEIEIVDMSSEAVDTIELMWDVNSYYFNEGPKGTFQLRPLLDAQYELVLKDAGNDDAFDSDIDPITGLSAPFTFESCDGEIKIDIGIREI